MQSCWAHSVANRPSSDAVANTLAGITEPKMIKDYLDRLRSAVQDRIQETENVGCWCLVCRIGFCH